MKTSKELILQFTIMLCLSWIILPQSLRADNDEDKIVQVAKSYLNKTNADAEKLCSSVSWDAVKYCALKADIIDETQYNSLKHSNIIEMRDVPVEDISMVPKGYLIGFFRGGTLVHVMIATGNKKAIGTKNKEGISLGTDTKWEEISLSAIILKNASFTPNGKSSTTLRMKPISSLRSVIAQGVSNVSNSSTTTSVEWHYETAETIAKNEYEQNKKDFPEIKSWEDYVKKANEFIRNPPSGTFSKKLQNNDLILYDKKSNIFIVADPHNRPVKMSKPEEGIARYNYWTSSKHLPPSNIDSEYDLLPIFESESPNVYFAPEARIESKNAYGVVTFDSPGAAARDTRGSQPQSQNNRSNSVDNAVEPSDNDDHPPIKLLNPGTSADAPSEPEEDPSVDYSLANKVKTSDWAKEGNNVGAMNASNQYNKNKSEFKKGITLTQYVAVAQLFKQNPPATTLITTMTNGDVVHYHQASNLLGIYDKDGKPKSLSKPKNGIAEYNKIVGGN